VAGTALWTDRCDSLRSTIFVDGHAGCGALGSARAEYPARPQNAYPGWDRGTGSAADCGFRGGVWLRGITPTEQIAQFRTGQGRIYAALLVLFAIMPWAANWWLERLARTPR